MLKDITIGQHFPGESVIHHMDPRAKLLLTLGYIVMLIVGSNALGLALAVAFLLLAYGVSQIPLRLIGKSLKPILPIVLFTAILNLFFVPGTP
ncbi:MAG: CbiQ family ECF transporter T component, partial [Pygmaiobacter sp.]